MNVLKSMHLFFYVSYDLDTVTDASKPASRWCWCSVEVHFSFKGSRGILGNTLPCRELDEKLDGLWRLSGPHEAAARLSLHEGNTICLPAPRLTN